MTFSTAATLTSSSITGLQALAKLVSCSYSQEVHKYLTVNRMAPKLYGYAEVDGAPTAYVMEYLDPSARQKNTSFSIPKLWILNRERLSVPLSRRSNPKICSRGSLNRCDRRTSESLILTEQWEEGQACYPAERNTDIQWPGEAGEPIRKGHDSEMVDS